ncbi:hypothetical protein G3I60_20175 [Streptomyces sp. SID13666]|uniref:hypothetical protein n=1 Tax=Streptomyces sp. SID13666 TaxID=2706054 RepID=UPI0013C1623F|nr:hypothetical protein [Streptomyces sp. SID13666]NEA56399.1 hypothetical protein [Streptomyces sp. SID13666]
MASDIVRRDGDGLPERRPRREAARHSRQERELVHRHNLDIGQLMATGKHEEVKAILRKQFTEDGMQDVVDIANLARDLVGEDPFLAALIVPIAQEYARTTSRDIRDYGRRRGL